MDTTRLLDVIQLAILVVEKNGRLKRGELPRLAQVLLGNMMFREDSATAAAIAYDVDPTDGSLALRIKNGWNSMNRPSPGPLGQGIELSHDVVHAVHRIVGPEGYRLIRAKIHKKRWGDVAKEFPGRDAISLKEDHAELLRVIDVASPPAILDFDDFLTKNVIDPHNGVKILT